jgi:hypothetical protein
MTLTEHDPTPPAVRPLTATEIDEFDDYFRSARDNQGLVFHRGKALRLIAEVRRLNKSLGID